MYTLAEVNGRELLCGAQGTELYKWPGSLERWRSVIDGRFARLFTQDIANNHHNAAGYLHPVICHHDDDRPGGKCDNSPTLGFGWLQQVT